MPGKNLYSSLYPSISLKNKISLIVLTKGFVEYLGDTARVSMHPLHIRKLKIFNKSIVNTKIIFQTSYILIGNFICRKVVVFIQVYLLEL